jgi:hypothetical protein
MAINEYDPGDVALIGAIFTVAGVPTAPAPLPTCTITPPSPGVETTAAMRAGTADDWATLGYAAPFEATGFYAFEFDTDEATPPGQYKYRCAGLGTAKSAQKGFFQVVEK